MFRKFKQFLSMAKNRKNMDLKKEEYRGTLKQIMKVRGLRTISLSNYNNWKGNTPDSNDIHSVKLDIMSGYLNIYGYSGSTKAGRPTCSDVAIEDATAKTYQGVYEQVMNILNDEKNIPYRVRKNILVRVAR